MIIMRALLILTQTLFLFYSTVLSPSSGQPDKLRFVCYGLIIIYGLFLSFSAGFRKPRVLDVVAVSLLLFAFLSHSYSINSQLTRERSWANLLIYLAVFWGLWAACRTPAEAIQLLRSLLFVWICFYIVNIAFVFTHPGEAFNISNREAFSEGYSRFRGATANPNAIGNFSAIILPIALWNLHQKKNLINAFFFGAVVFSFFFSFSRNAFICSVIGASLYLYLTIRRGRLLLVVMAIISIGLMILYADVLSRHLPEALLRSQSMDKLGGRSEAWEAALELIKKKPLLGHGFGTEDLLFDYYGIRFEIHSGAYAHNSFLGLALQLGWGAACFVYLSFIVFFLRSFLKVRRLKSESHSLRALTIALYASCFSGFWTTLFESWLYAPGGIIAFPFFVCLMLLMRLLDFQKATLLPQATHVRHRG